MRHVVNMRRRSERQNSAEEVLTVRFWPILLKNAVSGPGWGRSSVEIAVDADYEALLRAVARFWRLDSAAFA